MDAENGTLSSVSTINRRTRPVGWKAMPYILGNETLERLATFGLAANFMVYLRSEYHMDQVRSATLINTWSAFTNFAPIIGAFISDSYVGKFKTIVFGSVAELLGMVILTLTALLPELRPLPCAAVDDADKCFGYSNAQIGVLICGLFWLSVGTGGIRSCSVPFSLDQFDMTTEEGREGSRRFFTWYYTTHTLTQLISQTLLVYIQNDVSWTIGFAVPTALMLVAIIFFFVGTRYYVYVKPGTNVVSHLAQLFLSAFQNRKIQSTADGGSHAPLLVAVDHRSDLVLSDHFRFLNKAAIVTTESGGDNEPGQARKRRKAFSVEEIEEAKSVIGIIPIFATSIVGLLAMNQQQTFTVSQAMKMDLRVPGTSYNIPAGSISVISLLTIGIWLPFYDAVLAPFLEKLTHKEGGITLLQKVGIGNIFAFITMIISGIIEQKRRQLSLSGSQMSAFWLAPSQILMGFHQVYTIVGLTEFFNKQVPANMRSVGNSLLYLALAAASYLSTSLVNLVQSITARGDKDGWLADDLDNSRLDSFYFLVAGISSLNLLFFLFFANRFSYIQPN